MKYLSVLMLLIAAGILVGCVQAWDTRLQPTPVVVERQVVVPVAAPDKRDELSLVIVVLLVILALLAIALVVTATLAVGRARNHSDVQHHYHLTIEVTNAEPYAVYQAVAQQLQVTPLTARRLIESGAVKITRPLKD